MNQKILVVEDTDHVREMLVHMLDLDGFQVVGEASSAQAAIDMISQKDPDVVVMDYKMPDMDGLTAAKTIRNDRPSQAIILYTAYLDPELETQAKEAGVALCIAKLEGLNQLERRIRELAGGVGPDS